MLKQLMLGAATALILSTSAYAQSDAQPADTGGTSTESQASGETTMPTPSEEIVQTETGSADGQSDSATDPGSTDGASATDATSTTDAGSPDGAEATDAGSSGQATGGAARWGADDQLGAANLMTPETVLQAAELITTGKVYSLGIVVDATTPAFPPRSLDLTVIQPGQTNNSGLGDNQFTYNDDIFTGWLGIGPQIDGLGHAGTNHVYYGDRQLNDFAAVPGLTELGLENLPGLVGRGVLLNMAEFYGQEIVEEGTPYTREDIMAAAEQQGVEIREGDIVLFHSGWLNLLDGENADTERYGSVEPGVGVSGGEYLAEIGVMAVGADTWGMEVVPAENPGQAFRVHQILQPENGIYILENMDTRELAADDVSEFFFVLGQARLRGAVQMIINPIAIR